MTNMIDYVKNVAKSVAYSVSDELSETAETSKSFVTTNKEVLSEIYSSMRDLRKLSRRATSYVKKSKIYEAADEGIKATLEDIKTGKFYNKERIAKFEERALGSMMDFNDDDSGLDFDFDNSDTSVDNDNDDMLKGFDDVEEAVVMSSRDNAAAVSTTIGKVGAASIAAGKANTMLLYDQQIKTNSIMEKGFSSIFDRLGQMNKVNTDLVSTHADNSARFYESTTKLLQEQNVLLRQIVENQKLASGATEKKKPTNSTITFNDVIGANGELDIKNYAKNIKQNLINEMPPELKMIFGDSIGGEGSNLLLTFAASPLQFITKFVAKSLIPSVTKQAVKEFDNTLSGAFSGILARFNKMANDQDNDSEISRILGRVFGVKTNRVQSVNPKDYNKGQMPWNGIAQKSLTEVIPGYLRRIEALLSGEGERVYKWSEGKWETGREFRRNFERLKDSDISSAYGDIKYQMSDLLKRTTYFSEEEWKTINKNMDAFLKTIVSQDYGNPRFRKGDENKFYRYGVENDDIMRLLINTFQATSRSNRAQLSRKSYQARNNMANRLNNILETNMELIEMFNGSDIDKGFTWEKDGGRRTKAPGFLYNNAINKILDDHGHNVFWYLQRMYSEMVMFREAGYGGSGGGRRRSRNSHTPAPMPSNNTSTSGSASSNGRKIRTSRAIAEARTIENRSPLYESDEWMYNYLPDESLETQRIQRREQNRRAEYERGLKEARNKGLILYNSYDEGIISLINQRVNELSRESYGRRNYDEYTNSKDYKRNGSDSDTWINTAQSNARKRRERINRIDQRIRESGNDAEKYGFFDRLLAAEDTSEKLAVFTNSIDNVLQAPQKFLTNIMLKADERLYNLVFGDGEVHMLNGKPVNSIMEEITFQIKDTFGKLNKWIDEKILTPFKDKGIHTIGDIFQKIGGMFGVDLKESFAKLKEGIKKKAKSVADSTREAAGAARDFVNGSNNKKSNTRTNATNRIDINNGSIIDLFNAVGESFEDTDLDDILTDIELIAKNAHADNSIDSFDATYERSGKTNFYIDDEFIKNFTKSLGDQRFNKVKTRKDLDKLSVKNRRELMQLLIDSKNKDIKENQDKRFKMDEEITGKIFAKYGIDIKNSTIMKKIASGDLDRSTLLRAKKLQEIANNDKLDINRNAVKRLEELNNIKNRVAPGLNSRSISKDSIMKYVSENNASLDDVTKYIQESYLDNLSYNLYTKLIGDYKKETGKDFDFATLMTADENGEFDLDNNADFSKFIELLSYVTERQNVIDKNNAKKDLGEYLKTIGNKSLYNIDDLRKLGLDIRSNNGQLSINGDLEDILKAINSEESVIATMTSNARGTRYVTKTGITTIHEGEMIVPSELNPYNPNRGKVPKSTEIANENRVKNKFLRTLGKRIHSHSTGTYSFGTGSEMSGTIADIIPDDAEHYQKFTDENGNTIYRLKIKGNEFWHEYKLSKQQMAENGLSLDPNIHDYPPKGMPSRKIDINVNNGQTRDIELVQDKVVRGWHNALESAGMKEDYDKAMGAINKYGSAAAGGGLLGGGVGLGLSLLTGVAGGPIVGALVGAVGNIARKSDKVSNFLFGNIVDEETGERAGGLIDSEIQETFKKYAPSMSKMGIGGAIAGLVTPLGPLGGALIGSTLGFMKKNEDFQGLLFGEEGIFSEEDKTKFKKALPSIGLGAGVGALTGLLGGPFGLIGGALVGSAGGFLTTTNKFKDLVLGKEYDTGKKDEHGNPIMKRTGGVLGAVKTITIEPLKNGATYLKDHLKEFIDKDIVGPLKDGIKPVINMFKNGFETLKDTISNAINSVFEEKLGVPIGQFLKDKILNPLGKGAKTLLKLPFKMAGMAISAPFKLLGFVGNNIRANQIKKGKDLGSTAAERLAWREKHKIRSKKIFGFSDISGDGIVGNDGYKTVDENLLNLGDQDLSQLIDNIIAIQASDGALKGQKQDAIHSIRDLITPRFDTSEQIKIFAAVKSAANSGKGNYKKAFNTIIKIAKKKGLPQEEVDALIENLDERLHEFDVINYTDKNLIQNYRDEVNTQLHKLGFIRDKGFGANKEFDLKKIANMLKSEKQGRIRDDTWTLSENRESTDNPTDAIRDQTEIQENISGNVKDIASGVYKLIEILGKYDTENIVNGNYEKDENRKKKSEKDRNRLGNIDMTHYGVAQQAKEKNKKINKNISSNDIDSIDMSNNIDATDTSESIVNRAYGRFGGGSENAVVSQDELIVDPYSIFRSNQLTDEQKELFGDKGFDILYNPLDDDETRDKKARLRAQVTDVHNAFLSGKTMSGKKISRANRMNFAAAIDRYYGYGNELKNLNITDKSTEEELERARKLTEKQNAILSDIRTFMGVQTTDDGDVVKKLIDSKGNVYINKHDPKNKLGLQEGRTNNETNENVTFIRKALDKIHYGLFEKPMGKADENGNQASGVMGILGNIGKKVLKFGLAGIMLGGAGNALSQAIFGKSLSELLSGVLGGAGTYFKDTLVPNVKNKAKDIMTNVSQGLNTFFSTTLPNAASSAGQWLINTAGQGIQFVAEHAGDIGEAVIKGVATMAPVALDFLGGVDEGIKNLTGLTGKANRADYKAYLAGKTLRDILTGKITRATNLRLPFLGGKIISTGVNGYTNAANKIETKTQKIFGNSLYKGLKNGNIRGGGSLDSLEAFTSNKYYIKNNSKAFAKTLASESSEGMFEDVIEKEFKKASNEAAENYLKTVAKSASKATGKTVEEITEKGVTKSISNLSRKESKQFLKSLIQDSTGSALEISSSIKATTQAVSKSVLGGKIAGVLAVAAKKLTEKSNKRLLANQVGEAVADGIASSFENQSVVKRAVNKCIGGVEKAGANALENLSNVAMNISPIQVVFTLSDLLNPIIFPAEAKSILGIAIEPNFGQRVIAGLINMILGLIPGINFIPSFSIVDLLCNPEYGIIKDLDLFGITTLKRKSNVLVDAFNAETGLSLTSDEYDRYINGSMTATGLFNEITGTASEQRKQYEATIKENYQAAGITYDDNTYENLVKKYSGATVADDGKTIIFKDGTTSASSEIKSIQEEQLKTAESTNKQITTQTEASTTSVGLLDSINNYMAGIFDFITGGESTDYSSYVSSNATNQNIYAEYQSMLASGFTEEEANRAISIRYGTGTGRYSQKDKSINMRYNKPGDSVYQDINTSGCGPIAATNLINRHIKSGMGLIDPHDAAEYALSHGYKETNGGTDPRYFKKYFDVNGIDSRITSDKVAMRKAIENGQQVVLMGKNSKYDSGVTPYGPNPHYVVATGIQGSNIIVDNPEEFNEYTAYDARDTLNQSSQAIITNSKFGKGTSYDEIKFVQEETARIAANHGIKNTWGHTTVSTADTTNANPITGFKNNISSSTNTAEHDMYSLIHNDYGIETKEEKKKETEEEYNQPTAISNLKSSLERIRSDEYTASDFLNKYIKIDNKNKVRDIINAMFDIDKINYTNLFDKIPQTFNSEINNIYDQNTQNTFRLLFKALMHHYYGYIYKNHRDKIIENRKGPNYSKYLDDIASYFSNNSIIVLTDGKGNKLSTTSNENLISLLNDLNQYDANYEYPMENYVVSLAEKHNLTNNQSEKIAPVQTLWNFLRSLVSANSYITAYGRILKEMKNANISNMDQYNIEHMLYIPDKLMNSPILYPGGIGNKYLDLSDYGYDGPIIDEYNELVYYDQDKKRHTDFSLYYNNKIIPFMSLLNEHSSNIGLEKTNLTKNIAFFDKENFYSKTTESAEEFRTMFKNAAEATYPFLANQGNPYNKYVHPNFLINLYIEFLKKYSKNVENIQQEKEDLKASTTFSTKPQEFFKKYNRYYNESRYDKASLWDSPYRWPAIYEFSKNNDDIKNNLAYTMIKVLKNINPDLDLSTTKKADNYYSQFNDDNNALMSLSGALNEWSTKNYSNIEDFIPLKFTNKAKSSTTPYGDRTTGFIPELNTWSPSEVEDDDDMFNALFFRTFDLNNDTLKNAQTDEINDKFDNSKSGIDTLLDMAATGDNGLSVVTALITQKLIRSDYLKTPNIDNVAPTIYADLITNAVGASLLSSNPSAKFYTDLLSKIINDTNASKITSLLSSTTDSNTNDSIADAIKKVIGKEMTASASTLEGAQFVDIKNNHIFTKNDIEYLKYIRDAILASKFVGSNSENYKSKTVKELLADSEFTTNDVLDPARDLNNIINMLETDKNKNQLLTRFITNGRNSLDTVIPRYSYGELSSEKANTIRNILTDISTYFGNTEALTKLSVTENYVSKAQNDEILSSSDYSTIDKFNALNGSYETLAKWLQLQLLLNPKSVPSYKYYITEKDKDGNEIETLKTNKLDYEIDTGNPFEYIRKAFTQVGLMPAEMFSRLYLGPVYTQDPNNSEQILIEQPSDTINERFNSYFSDEFLNNSNSSVKINIGNKIAGDSPVMKFFRDKKTNNVSYSDNLLNILNELNGPHPEYIFGVDPGESGNSKNVSIKLKDFDYYAGKDSTIMKDFDKMVSFVLSKGEGFGEENVFKPIANYITKNFNGSNEALNKLLNSSNSEIINLLYRNTGGVKGGSEYIDEHGNVILASGLASIPEIAFEDLSVFSELTAREINDYLAKCYNANGSSYRPLDGMGSVFVSCAKKYKVNPRFVIAVMRQECSLGAGSDDPNSKMGNYNHNKKFNYTSIMPAGGQGNEEMCDFSKSNYTIGSVVFQKCSTHAQMIDNIFKFFAEISFKAPRLQKTVFALNYTDGYSYSGGSPGWLSNVCTFMESFPENTIAEYITPTDAQIAFYKKIEGKAFDKESVPENKQKENTLTSALFKIAEGVWGSDLITWIRNKFSGSSDSSSSERDILYQLQGSTTRNVADTFKVALTNEKGENNAYGGISSKFGPRNFKIAPQHMGVDILPNPSGSSPRIYSPVSGTILLAKDRGKNGIEYIREYSSGNYVFNPPAGYEKSNGYGKQVLIMDENGNVHLFAHLSDYDKSLKEGESISMGQYIGHMGTTGSSTGNHLHYGIMHPDQTRYTSLDNIYYKGHVPTSGEANDGLDWKNVPSKWFSDSYGWMNPDEYLADYLGYHQDELSKEAEERAIEAAAAAAEESSETSESTTGQGSGKMSPSELLITQGLKKSSSSSSSNYGTGGSDRVIELDSRSQSILKQGIKNANAKYGRGTAIGGAGGENTAELQTLKEITGILTSINNNTAKSNMFLAAFLKAVQNGEISTDSSMFSNMIKALSANSGLQTLASVGSTGNINKDLDDSTNTLINTMNTIARQ